MSSIAHTLLNRFYQSTPLILGHRGASGNAPMNTLSAFLLAHQEGAHGIELDVHLSADGIPVVIHDHTVDATTNGNGEVGSMTVQQLKQLDAGSWFSAEFANETIPTLEEVFLALPRDNFLINVEIKANRQHRAQLVQATLAVIEATQSLERVIISSFDPFILRLVARANSQIPIGYLHYPSIPFWIPWFMNGVRHEAIHPYYQQVNQGYIRQMTERGYKVHTWTVNDVEVARKLSMLGVGAIITDYPARIREAIQS
ncbi:MAG: glycerophosphodiester phosphodiesterase [Phototrophicaceae bacterium]